MSPRPPTLPPPPPSSWKTFAVSSKAARCYTRSMWPADTDEVNSTARMAEERRCPMTRPAVPAAAITAAEAEMSEATSLPSDLDAQPLVEAAVVLRPTLREYHDEIEREQRMPPALFEQLRAAGFYKMVIPRSLGGLQVDPLTYLRVVELLAEGAGSVGWNLANNSIGQLVTLGLPDEGVQEVHGRGAPSVIAGTAVQGGGQAVPVEGGYRVTGHWTFGSGCREASWMLGSFQILDGDQPRRRPDGGSLYWRGVFPKAQAEIIPGSWDVAGLRGTGSFDWTVKDAFLPERRTVIHAGMPLDNQWS